MSSITVLSRSQIIRVNPTSGKVAVINAGPPGPSGEVAFLTGPQNPSGLWTFGQSPVIPDPDAATEAATKGYTDAVVDALPTLEDGARTTVDDATPGQVKVQLASDVPRGILATGLASVANTAVETTIATFAVPANDLPIGAAFMLMLGGGLDNNSGAVRDATIRVKCNGTTVYSIAMAALAAAAGSRPFFAQFTGTITSFAGARVFGSGRFGIGNAALQTIDRDHLIASDISGTVPSTAHNWTVTIQFSAAHANLVINLNSAQMVIRK